VENPLEIKHSGGITLRSFSNHADEIVKSSYLSCG
jgi:hypothetical protein